MEVNDVVIVGSGIAALQLSALLNKDKKITMITKSELIETNSYLAQGGIAAAVGEFDTPNQHISDTLLAGCFHNNAAVVCEVLHEAPALIQELVDQGEFFDRDSNGSLMLGLEGAHSEKRILHSGYDATGKNLSKFLLNKLTNHIKIEDHTLAYQLIMDDEEQRCIGVKGKKENGTIEHYYGRTIVLATGGVSQVYRYSSNATSITGDGIAMAYLAGADMVDMEFIQFHPTLLFKDGETKGLITEAVRGEGATLVTKDGISIMEAIHPLKDLAPRHIVSQTIYNYVEQGEPIYLDIRSIKNFKARFPSVTSICEKNGVDLSKGRIPVVPGSHFMMGGIKTDLIGRTSIDGLFAIGEASCTGFHGANRLASNSLLEGLFQGKSLAKWINREQVKMPTPCYSKPMQVGKENRLMLPTIDELRDKMMKRVGIIRSEKQLEKQKAWLKQFSFNNFETLDSYSKEQITTAFLYINACLITEAALTRTESRGGHYRSDYPAEDQEWCKKSIIQNYKGEVTCYCEQNKVEKIT
jgi:L-aspartate oxidase